MNYIPLADLEVYKLGRELSRIGWKVYNKLDWRDKKVIGDQFISATDSVGVNIAEGYSRYHYLDKIKFFYNARGSLAEAQHWVELLRERDKIASSEYEEFRELTSRASIKLQNFISAHYKARDNKFP